MNWPLMSAARAALPVLLLLCSLGVARADGDCAPTAPDLARRAMTECEQGRHATVREERQSHFERGQQLAQQAVAADDNSAAAHFAVFCNMGELMRIDGESISSVFQLRKLMAELDRTLQIDPGHTDALSSKGQLLVRLPRLLGGNVEEGEAMLRQVIQKDPSAVASRLALARTCEARGDRDEALAFTTRALQIAREQGRADKVAEAQAILAELRADARQ
jgi:tetratricopeptide (TPR) repeat protein